MQYEHFQQSERKQGDKPTFSHAIVPLTVHQVKNLTKQNQIERQQFQHIVLIGKITSVSVDGNRYKILLDDRTGVLELTSLIHVDKTKTSVINEDLSGKQGQYYFVVITAKLRRENSQWTYFVDNLRQITNHDEITKHISDVVLSHLERTK